MKLAADPANAPAPSSAQDSRDRDLLIQLLAAGLGLSPELGDVEEAAWPGIVHHAVATKTAGLLAESARLAGRDLPQATDQKLAEIQAENLRLNLANLAWTIKASQVLEAAGIAALAFKGAIRAHEVYGRWDARASSDIDLLVASEDYRKACDVLDSAGFRPLVSHKSEWWHHHLGEAPFARTDGSGAIVDLHNSLQQPGGPFPVKLADFWTAATIKHFGTALLNTPSPQHSLLICAIGYGKAVRSGSPWLAYAHELTLAESAMSESEAQQMRELAAEQGLLRLYEDAVSNAMRLFSQEAQQGRFAAESSAISQENLVLSAVGQGHKDRFSRTKWLWDWCDGSGMGRGATFSKEIWRICRRDARQFVENFTGESKLRLPAGN